MKQQQNNPAPVPRKSYTLEDARGNIYSSHTDEEEAAINGSIEAEERGVPLALIRHTLH